MSNLAYIITAYALTALAFFLTHGLFSWRRKQVLKHLKDES